MRKWALVYEAYRPEEQGLREALCTLGNGYFATRGAFAEAEADGVHYPGTYLAGGYNRLKSEIAGRVIENEDLVNLPNWLPLTFRHPDGAWFDLSSVEVIAFRQVFDLRSGVLSREVRFKDPEGRETELRERRFVHMESPHTAALELTLRPRNWSGPMEFRSWIDGRVANDGVKRYKDLNGEHLEPLETGIPAPDTVFLKVRTCQSNLHIALAARTALRRNGELFETPRQTIRESGRIAQKFTAHLEAGEIFSVEKAVQLYTSRDHAVSECGLAARTGASRLDNFSALLKRHVLAWRHLWDRFDVHLEMKKTGDDGRTERILRLYILHLLQSSSPHTMDLDVGAPSRGWHGEAYRGHIFWDELFIFPFFNLRLPEITRSLLMYRYRRLGEARAAARREGRRGAMYPWQSGSSGREESQKVHLNPQSGRWNPDNSHLQRHINAAIAFNVIQYYQATRDMEFLSFYGAEMVLEIARFWSSMATHNRGSDRYEILGVMGPDEYHESYPWKNEPGLDNNAYTNLMAVWVLKEALEVLDFLPLDRREELCESLELHGEELERWRDISRKMHIPFHNGRIISQFEGYDRLEEFDWREYREKYGDIQRLDRILGAEGDTPNRYKASKQADVLMLFYLFTAEEIVELFNRIGYDFDPKDIPKNIEYYMKRTSHGSTLSRVVHSWVLARSDRERSWGLFSQALESDISDIQGGTTPEGIHLGAMAGCVNILQEAYTGLRTLGDELWLNPAIPEEVARLSFNIRYRGHALALEVLRNRLTVRSIRCTEAPIQIRFQETLCELRGGEERVFSY